MGGNSLQGIVKDLETKELYTRTPFQVSILLFCPFHREQHRGFRRSFQERWSFLILSFFFSPTSQFKNWGIIILNWMALPWDMYIRERFCAVKQIGPLCCVQTNLLSVRYGWQIWPETSLSTKAWSATIDCFECCYVVKKIVEAAFVDDPSNSLVVNLKTSLKTRQRKQRIIWNWDCNFLSWTDSWRRTARK